MNPDEKRAEEIRIELERSRWIDDVRYVPQKSEEWLRQRWNMVTASDLGQAMGVGHYGNVESLWRSKISPPEFLPNPGDGPLAWGNRYEDMSLRCYTQRFNRRVKEYGLIPHRQIEYFGASPDGISDTGVMIEIKSPYRRKINGQIMDQYMHQIQGQLETCDLEYCDFIECDFEQYRESEDYISYLSDGEKVDHGAIVKVGGKLVYSPEWLTAEECVEWVMRQDDNVEDVYYWRLLTIHIKRIRRDREFWARIRPSLDEFWTEVLRGRRVLEADPNARVAFKRTVVERKKVHIPYIKDDELEFVS